MRNDRTPWKESRSLSTLIIQIKVINIMTQATAVKPAVEVKTCATCPHFDNFHEKNGRGWCNQFNHFCREHYEITSDCITSSDLVVNHELEDNLDLFPNVDFEELDAFPISNCLSWIPLRIYPFRDRRTRGWVRPTLFWVSRRKYCKGNQSRISDRLGRNEENWDSDRPSYSSSW